MKINDIDRRIADLIAINPRPSQPTALVEMGRDMLARDIDAATKCFDKALSIDPRYVPAWIARSDALCIIGRKGQAVGCLERALDVDPKNEELAERKKKILADLAQASSRNRKFEPPPPPPSQPKVQAPASQPKVQAPAPPSDPRFDAELDAKPKSEPKPAPKSDPRPAVKPAPKTESKPEPKPEKPVDPACEEVAALLAAGKHIEALRKVEPLTKLPEVSLDVWMLRGAICAGLDQKDAEITSYERATRVDPKSVPAWMALSKARLRAKRPERALEAADQAQRLAPFDPNVQKLRGTLLLGLMQGAPAVQAFEKATQHAPDDAEAWLQLARAQRALRQLGEARETAQRALSIAETMQPELVPAVCELLEKLK